MKRIECLTTIVVAAAAASPAAADFVILESNAPAYTAGGTMAADATIMLDAGESIVLVSEDARIVRVAGPHDGPAGDERPQESAVRKALDRLVSPDQPRVGGIGAVRGDDEESAVADTRLEPWLLHAERGGEQCALRGRPIELWREPTAEAATAEITAAESDSTLLVRWARGSARAEWPAADLAPMDGKIYLVRLDDQTRSVAIKLMLLEPTIASDPLSAAAWLAAKGCMPQARLALR